MCDIPSSLFTSAQLRRTMLAARTAIIGMALLVTPASLAGQQGPRPVATKGPDGRPPAVFVSKHVCPFERFTYREWVARRAVRLYERPRGHATGPIKKGEPVQDITGVVITHPLAFKATKQEGEFPAGATAHLPHPLGEGVWRGWYRGKFLSVEADYFPHGQPEFRWWAKARAASGRIGWVRMGKSSEALPFDKVDVCG
jgi:hypothetical protein